MPAVSIRHGSGGFCSEKFLHAITGVHTELKARGMPCAQFAKWCGGGGWKFLCVIDWKYTYFLVLIYYIFLRVFVLSMSKKGWCYDLFGKNCRHRASKTLECYRSIQREASLF